MGVRVVMIRTNEYCIRYCKGDSFPFSYKPKYLPIKKGFLLKLLTLTIMLKLYEKEERKEQRFLKMAAR